MAELTLSARVSTTIDGLTTSASATQVTTVREYIELTKDVSGSTSQVWNEGWGFCVVVNTGDVEMIAEIGIAAEFMVFSVPAGAHLVLPNAVAQISGDIQAANGLSLYTASGSSRALVLIGIW